MLWLPPTTMTKHRRSCATPYNQVFGNLQRVRVKCTLCAYSTEQYERAHAHSLSLAKQEITDLGNLLTDHLGSEFLDKDYQCNNEACRQRGHGKKTTEVIHWPPVLVVSLKRFAFNGTTRQYTKISRSIAYPMVFPISDTVTYTLRAVIEHQGPFGRGHYVTYVRGHNELWYYCNDSAPPKIIEDPTSVLQQQAYMLIYER